MFTLLKMIEKEEVGNFSKTFSWKFAGLIWIKTSFEDLIKVRFYFCFYRMKSQLLVKVNNIFRKRIYFNLGKNNNKWRNTIVFFYRNSNNKKSLTYNTHSK